MVRARQLNIRIPEGLNDELAAIADEEGLDKADVARQMLVRSVRSYRLERAIRRYRTGQISMSRAAEEAQISLYDMMDELGRQGLGPGVHYRVEELRDEIARLRTAAGGEDITNPDPALKDPR